MITVVTWNEIGSEEWHGTLRALFRWHGACDYLNTNFPTLEGISRPGVVCLWRGMNTPDRHDF